MTYIIVYMLCILSFNIYEGEEEKNVDIKVINYSEQRIQDGFYIFDGNVGELKNKIPDIPTDVISTVETRINRNGIGVIYLQLDEKGKELLLNVTQSHIGEPIAIVFGGKILSSPIIIEPLSSGEIVIDGNYSIKEANELVEKIKNS